MSLFNLALPVRYHPKDLEILFRNVRSEREVNASPQPLSRHCIKFTARNNYTCTRHIVYNLSV